MFQNEKSKLLPVKYNDVTYQFMQAVWKRYVDCTYQCAFSNATHSNKIWLFPFSGSAETLLKKNAEPILHIAGLDVTIVKVIDFSLI